MTSQVLARLERQMKLKREQAPPPAPSGLGEAIEQIIRQQVEERVADALEKQKPVHNPKVPPYLREFKSQAEQHDFPPPTPRTAAPRDMTISTTRDELKRLKYIDIGNDVRFEVQRDGEGRVVRMVQLD